jgi:pantoate--beta-alanine ligase
VVCKLLNIVQPTRAYFGQKDAQQVAVVQQMVRDLSMPTTIVVVPTVREPDGLAMSSRNSYLSPEQRAIAPLVYQALLAVQARYETGERDAALLRAAALTLLERTAAISIEYVSVADPLSLRELETVGVEGALVSLAVRLGGVRLIDNLFLGR